MLNNQRVSENHRTKWETIQQTVFDHHQRVFFGEWHSESSQRWSHRGSLTQIVNASIHGSIKVGTPKCDKLLLEMAGPSIYPHICLPLYGLDLFAA